jgi:ABC-type transport system involved in Fe-S cluster assembly fused permease/ATPase subunit
MAVSTVPPLGWKVLYYLYPTVVFSFFVVSMLLSSMVLRRTKQDDRPRQQTATRRPLLALVFGFVSTYFLQIVLIGVDAIIRRQWIVDEPAMVGYLSCILVYGTQFTMLNDSASTVSNSFYASWFIALPFELIIGGLHLQLTLVTTPLNTVQVILLVLTALRCFSLLTLAGSSVICVCLRKSHSVTDEERQKLLSKDATQSQAGSEAGYGTTEQENSSSGERIESTWERLDREAREAMEKRFEEGGGNWFAYLKDYSIMFPYIWPVHSPSLQFRALGVAVCLLASNALNVLIPRQTGIIIDTLNGTTNANPWTAVAVFAILRLASSQSGIELIRQWLWTPIKYYSYDALTRAVYSHVMRLSADFHDSKSTSEMMVAFWGSRAVSNAVESVILQAVPMLFDLTVAVVYLSVTFGAYEGFIVVATGTIFLMLASRLIAKSTQAAREKESSLYQEHYLRQTGLTGWQTVSAFNHIGYEENRHAEAVTNRWLKHQQFVISWAVSIAFQTAVLTCGLLASAFLAVVRIRAGAATPGQFTMLLMYWSQLTSPLQFFARLGKSIGDDFIEGERLLDMMKQKPSIESKKGARPLKFQSGEVHFNEVCFSYDKKKEILQGVTFDVPSGQTVAFVGATGAGKSTILKLLNRFYDVTAGSVMIDGQDIRDVDLYSLRDRIGVVPQSPILFDDTIINNVRYGRLTATDEEVYEACRAACIHDKIESFTNGYRTHVGERGMKLSGGELQRLAIARAILKQPDIVILDEATSAVDTDTEQQIQASLKTLCRGRTTFIVA